ncbi:carbon-nitrogen hydrolase family protein [Siminovitchia sediminis]|uniref:Carbon-nitrogen hydrolase family protein n=1 Tax=Siminovitchia sediminis TaxID=1274353 RepID=A0ABW4KEZ2_9BACI
MELNVAAVQYYIRDIKSEADFVSQVEQVINRAMKDQPQFIVFPEFFTTQLACLISFRSEYEMIRDLHQYTDLVLDLFRRLSVTHEVHIVGGSHVVQTEDGRFVNRSCLFYPDGTFVFQDKIHLTQFEKNMFELDAGSKLNVFETEWTKVALLTCYDIEFPELSRKAAAEGAEVIFCPSWTETMHGAYRVDHCAKARAIENQLFVVKTATLSDLPKLEGFSTNAGFAGIYSPCDPFFPEDGVLAKGINNKEMIVTGTLDISSLRRSRRHSPAPLLRDIRNDLYAVEFSDAGT